MESKFKRYVILYNPFKGKKIEYQEVYCDTWGHINYRNNNSNDVSWVIVLDRFNNLRIRNQYLGKVSMSVHKARGKSLPNVQSNLTSVKNHTKSLKYKFNEMAIDARIRYINETGDLPQKVKQEKQIDTFALKQKFLASGGSVRKIPEIKNNRTILRRNS